MNEGEGGVRGRAGASLDPEAGAARAMVDVRLRVGQSPRLSRNSLECRWRDESE